MGKSFDASCRTLISGKMLREDLRDVRNAYFFNEELNCVIMSTYRCEIKVFRPKEVQGKSYLAYDESTYEYADTIGLAGQE